MPSPSQTVQIPIGPNASVTGRLVAPVRTVLGVTPGLVLAHGAGGGLDDPLLSYLQIFLRGRGYVTLAFNFPYRERDRKVPDREDVLERTLQAAVDWLREHPRCAPGPCFVGGKSMGGRMASHLAARGLKGAGLLLLAYPLHAPGRPDRVRDQHLSAIRIPTLFVSGTRDALAPRDSLAATVEGLRKARLVWIEGGDHSFKMLRSSGRSAEDVWLEIAETVSEWLDGIVSGREKAASRKPAPNGSKRDEPAAGKARAAGRKTSAANGRGGAPKAARPLSKPRKP